MDFLEALYLKRTHKVPYPFLEDSLGASWALNLFFLSTFHPQTDGNISG